MANVAYHKNADGSYINISCPGGPNIFKVQWDINSAAFYPQYTYDGGVTFVEVGSGFPTVAQAQAALDNFVSQINNGTLT